MANHEPSQPGSDDTPDEPPLTPERIEQQAFAKARKGLDEKEVRAFLRRVADEFDALNARLTGLEEKVRTPALPSREQLVNLVGEEVARTLHSAEKAAEEVAARARENATRIERAANEEAARVRSGQLEQATQDAHAIVEAARQRGREMVAEARALRERVISDLNRRRDMLRSYIEQLRTDRDRFAEAYRVVRDTVSDANEVLTRFGSGRPFPPVTADAGPAPAYPSELKRPTEPEAHVPAPSSEPEPEPATDAPPDGGAEATGIGLGELPGRTEPTTAPRPEPQAVRAGGADGEDGADGTGSEPQPVREDEPEPPRPPERRPEPEPLEAAAPQPRPPREPDAPREPGRQHAHQPELDPTAVSEPQPGEDDSDVDALFARIRAGREDAVENAEPSLDDESGTREHGPAGTATKSADTAVLDQPEAEPRPDTAGDAVVLARRDELLTPVAHDLARRCKRVLQDEQNVVLDALRRQRGRATADTLLPPLPEQVANWAEVMAPAIIEAYVAARAAASPGREPVNSAPQRMVTGMVEVLVTPLRERLLAAVGDTLAQDAEPDVIAQRIGARYREWKGEELDSRIGDLLAAVYARGVYDAAPEGSKLRWVPAEQGQCPDADDNALEPTRRGERFPTGQQFPPAHPGCRCLLAVVHEQ